MSSDTFGARDTLEVSGREFEIFRLDAFQDRFDVARLPYSLKVLLENALRLEDGESVTRENIEAIASWDAAAEPSAEIPFQPARVLMQDFTGVPALVDLAAMRDAMDELGGDPRRSTRWSRSTWSSTTRCRSTRSETRAPSTSTPIATTSATASATRSCAGASRRSTTSGWCPPATGICHQVNLEYLGQVVFSRDVGARARGRRSRPIPTPWSARTRTRR